MKKGNIVENIFAIVFSLVGVICLIIAVIALCFTLRFQGNAEQGIGHIVARDISVATDADLTNPDASTWIAYTVNRSNYVTGINVTSSNWYVGKQLPIWIHNEDPHRIQVAGAINYLVSMITGGVGIVFFLIGMGFTVALVSSRKNRARLLATGRKVYGTVVGWHYNTAVSVNGRNPFVLDVEYEDPFSGETKQYRSGNLWENPYGCEGKPIAIYLDPENPRKYYVDIENF